MFRNFHFIVALLVAPFLAILAWYAADAALGDREEKAQEGLGYELLGDSNCRYESGTCTMSNGNFELDIQVDRVDDAQDKLAVRVKSAHPLDGINMGWVSPGAKDAEQTALRSTGDKRTQWEGVIPGEASTEARMRVLAQADETSYYGEAKTVFIDYETSFGEDFRK